MSSHLEYVRSLCQTHQRHVAAIGPTSDSHSVHIDTSRLVGNILQPGHLVFHFNFTLLIWKWEWHYTGNWTVCMYADVHNNTGYASRQWNTCSGLCIRQPLYYHHCSIATSQEVHGDQFIMQALIFTGLQLDDNCPAFVKYSIYSAYVHRAHSNRPLAKNVNYPSKMEFTIIHLAK